MNLVGSSLHLFLLLSLASTLLFNLFSLLFLFSLFSTIVLAIIVGNYRPPEGEADWDWPSSLTPIYEDRKDTYYSNFDDDNGNDVKDNSDSDDDEDDEKNGSFDGYDEDDDDDGSDGEIGWDDDEQTDANLEIRIEAFISKVTNGWREEWLRDNGHAQMSQMWFG